MSFSVNWICEISSERYRHHLCISASSSISRRNSSYNPEMSFAILSCSSAEYGIIEIPALPRLPGVASYVLTAATGTFNVSPVIRADRVSRDSCRWQLSIDLLEFSLALHSENREIRHRLQRRQAGQRRESPPPRPPSLFRAEPAGSKGRIYLIDAMSFIFRAYHAMARQRPMSTKTGIPTSATFVFVNMLRKLRADFEPQYLAAVFDVAAPTFRDEQASAMPSLRKFDSKTQTYVDKAYDGYKANRASHAGRPGAAGAVHPARARGLSHPHDRGLRLRGRRRDRHAGAQGRGGGLFRVCRLQRQGHDAVGQRAHLRAQSAEGQSDLRRRQSRRDPGRAARAKWWT